MDDGGVVEQKVRGAELCNDLAGPCFDCRCIRYIHGCEEVGGGKLFLEAGDRLRIASATDDGVAEGDEGADHFEAQAFGTASDENQF